MKKIQIEGINYLSSAFNGEEEIGFEAKSAFHHRLSLFLREWYSPSLLLTLHTSGSTGKPKEIIVRKDQMLQSAAITCDYLGL
ncbi:MAG: O-succinylbenzoic acid--CoA ligase, partial [Petrimonas sp.]|nr:O-succinylbenzoic acid--CoA ligase [Petrimonas sp.]